MELSIPLEDTNTVSNFLTVSLIFYNQLFSDIIGLSTPLEDTNTVSNLLQPIFFWHYLVKYSTRGHTLSNFLQSIVFCHCLVKYSTGAHEHYLYLLHNKVCLHNIVFMHLNEIVIPLFLQHSTADSKMHTQIWLPLVSVDVLPDLLWLMTITGWFLKTNHPSLWEEKYQNQEKRSKKKKKNTEDMHMDLHRPRGNTQLDITDFCP